jgi:hypothetical protein
MENGIFIRAEYFFIQTNIWQLKAAMQTKTVRQIIGDFSKFTDRL